MRVLVTGATGFVGGGVVRALRARGHAVIGLARSDTAATALQGEGVTPLRGDLADADVLARAAAGVDAVVQAGFPRDAYARLDVAVALDRAAMGALLPAARRVLYVSGIGVLGDAVAPGGTVDDDTEPAPPPAMAWRRELELATLARGGQVVRPVFVHGHGRGDILTSLVHAARVRGEAAYPGPGTDPWPTVHVDDLGDAVTSALESGPAGLCVNVAAGATTARAVSERLGSLLGVPARALPPAEADGVVPYARWLGGSWHVDARRARDLLGERPRRPGLLDDLPTYLA